MAHDMATAPSSPRRVQRVRHELRRRELQVLRVQPLGEHFVAITFGGPELDGFTSLSFDDHVKFMLEHPGAEPVRRDYTPRHHDAQRGELTLEFALHGDGEACRWAQQAQPGQRALIGGPRGSLIIPLDWDWHLLAGDATALPAISRRIEELPAGARALVLVQVDSAADQRQWNTAAEVHTQWVATSDEWLAALAALQLPAGEGFAWCAGEASVMAQARRMLIEDKGLAKENIRAAAYWKRGASAFHANLDD